MNLLFKTRPFYPDELRLLNALKTQKEKAGNGIIKWYNFIIAGLLGAGFTYIAAIIPDSFWTFLFGTIAVFSFAFIVFMPWEIYKFKKENKALLQELTFWIDQGTVDTCRVIAERIAVAPEYEDESDLYIVELNKNEVLYLWDSEYNLNKKFPCREFEIYEDRFSRISDRRIYPLSDKMQPVKIGKKAKWNFMKQYGIPGHLETEKINFDELLEKYRNCA